MYLDRAKKMLQELNFVDFSEIKPCTKEQIQSLEQHLGIFLPHAYTEFLLWIGGGAGIFMIDEDCFYKQIWDLRENAVELLEENDFPEELPDDAFVFFMHQGYHFGFIRTSEGDNPPIHYYHEGHNKLCFTINYRNNLDEFLLDLMEQQEKGIVELEKQQQERRNKGIYIQGLD